MASIEEIRKEIEAKLDLLSTEEKENQSKNVYEKLVNLDLFQKSRRISIYLSTKKEVNTEPIIRKILEDGKECFVPTFNKKGMEMVKLKSMEDWETLPFNSWGIRQPSFKDKRENAMETGGLDLIIVPGVAFTINNVRVGHGGGYYDRFLKTMKETEDVDIIGLAFKEQIVDCSLEHNLKMSTVLFGD